MRSSQLTANSTFSVIKDPVNLMQNSKINDSLKDSHRQPFVLYFPIILFKHYQQGKNLKTLEIVTET